MNKPTVSLFELGCGLGLVAGMEAAEGVCAPSENPHFRISGLFDSSSADEVEEYIRELDASVGSLGQEIAASVKRQAFLSSWATWRQAWESFKAAHDTRVKILLAGKDTTMSEARELQRQLEGWRGAFQKETGQAPSGVLPSTQAPEGKPAGSGFFSVSTSTKVLLALGVITALGALGYATYRYIKRARADIARAERLSHAVSESLLTSKLGGLGGIGHGAGQSSEGVGE